MNAEKRDKEEDERTRALYEVTRYHPVSAAILGLERIGHFPVLGDCYFVSASLVGCDGSGVQKRSRNSRRYTGYWCSAVRFRSREVYAPCADSIGHVSSLKHLVRKRRNHP